MTESTELPEPSDDELAAFAAYHPADPDIEGTAGVDTEADQ